ncbi:helix-turn-helix transcriptional regulator [Paenibacillus radicis (ex Xue et al. 2023)]|uniref:WYL domain-containing protein n=1 Tax=Paenibacillus radicis (ex Xue et al. 2023) TaxID=2972489 RepID=A0ABT1YEB7_9BACL|nr:WYL domain-containing protein [Paenibacillus radicis (ex Xue et al. 2023)]MCR8631532.1 WYL domain-containing protein [Paenibacillus radicis (ex Xue et al. 2023)]
MARESFDKEIQFLRMLALAGGAYSRQQFADRLGISVHTYDKTLRNLKEMVTVLQQGLPLEQGTELSEGLRYNYYESADPLLLFLFRAKSIKETESIRLTLLLTAVQSQELSARDLQDICSEQLPADCPLPDEKTIRGDLKYLEEVGVIIRSNGGRPYRYRAANDLVNQLSDDELMDLFDYVDVIANTQIPSVQGYLLRDTLKKVLRKRGFNAEAAETHRYKYNYHSRILDEAHLYTIFRAIQQRKKLHFLYLSPKKGKNYASQNTNPLFERETKGITETVLPLRVIYDHQYGRWYLIGHNTRIGIMKFRMEGLTQIEEGDTVQEEEFTRKLSAVEEQMKTSWVTDTMRTIKVVARFYNPEISGANFIRERVEAQGQWGTITDESEATFRYEINVNGIYEIKPWLRSFGSSCEVLEPAWLRKEFIAEWKEIHNYYESIRENI